VSEELSITCISNWDGDIASAARFIRLMIDVDAAPFLSASHRKETSILSLTVEFNDSIRPTVPSGKTLPEEHLAEMLALQLGRYRPTARTYDITSVFRHVLIVRVLESIRATLLVFAYLDENNRR
jgi:hypothetical protein